MTGLDLMRARADVLFTYDERGRMVSRNDPERKPAPRLFLAYTSAGYVLRLGQDVSDAMETRLQSIVGTQPPVADMRSAPPVVSAIQDVLEQPASGQEGGPVYRFPEMLWRVGGTVRISEDNVYLARDTFPWLLTELADWRPCFAVVHGGAAVSVCFSARIGAAVCEAGVETLPDFRGRGYAAGATSAWARAIRDSSRVPLYSTSWGNLASQAVARRLGLTMVGADAVWL